MKKILYLITQAEWGGAQRYIFDLATSEEAKNCDILVAFGQSKDNALADELTAKNIKIRPLKRLVRPISPISDILGIFELARLYRQFQPDIIHLNSTKAGIIGSLASIFYSYQLPATSYQLIYTVHGWVFNEPMNFLKKKLYLWLEKFTAKFKNKIICVSEFDRQIAIKHKIAPENKLITIHNGIDVAVLNFLPREEARKKLLPPPNLPLIKGEEKVRIGGLPLIKGEEKIIIGTIANFYPAKGLEYLIEVFDVLIKTYQLPTTSYQLIIIGGGELRPLLENLIAEKNLQDSVFLVGKKENAAQYLKAFDVYVCSSIKEGFPYSILEAMAAELPIVTTIVGGIPEIIDNEKTGLIVKPAKAKAMAEKIKNLIDDSSLAKQLAAQAKINVQEKFSRQKMVNTTFDQYNVK